MAFFMMSTGSIHDVRREFDPLDVEARLGGVALKGSDLSAMAVRQVPPLYFVRRDPNEAFVIRYREGWHTDKNARDYQAES